MLPIQITGNKDLQLMQNRWAAELNPLLRIPMLSGLQLSNIALINGVTTINHLLDRNQQGWFLTDIDGAAEIYRSQPFNNKTLTLTSNAAVTVSLWVY